MWHAKYNKLIIEGPIRKVQVVFSQTVQRTRYYPSGLPWEYQAGDSTSLQPRKYGGKEFVEAHGLDMYDNEARWYYPAIARTITMDPLAEKYYSISPYAWCGNNPVNWVDSNGKWIESAWDAFSLAIGVNSLIDNVQAGNVGGAILDGIGIVADAAALVLPAVPGGVGAGIKAARAGDKAANAMQVMDKGADAAKTVDKATDGKKTYQTYTKTNSQTGEVYSGRTSGTGTPIENVRNRDKNHHMNDKGFGPAELDASSSNPNAIRGREQQNIEKYGGAKSQGGTSGNAINGISPNNPKRDMYLEEAKKTFGNN